MSEAIAPSPTNGCYGWLIWVNAGRPCIGPRITERPMSNNRATSPTCPADMYRFSGLFGQLVTVFPTQDIVVVRTGQDRGLVFSGGESWERGLYSRVLGSITDQKIKPPGPAPKVGPSDNPNADFGFQNALREPDQYEQGRPSRTRCRPPGPPARARAAGRAGQVAGEPKRGVVALRLACPLRWPARLGADLQGRRADPGRPPRQALRDPRRMDEDREAAAHRRRLRKLRQREAPDAATCRPATRTPPRAPTCACAVAGEAAAEEEAKKRR